MSCIQIIRKSNHTTYNDFMNQLKFRSLLLTLLYLGAVNCVAQNLHGSVKSQSGDAIPFASISVLNTSWGTASDNDGNFNLNLTNGTYQISISAVGYASKVKPVVLTESTDNPRRCTGGKYASTR